MSGAFQRPRRYLILPSLDETDLGELAVEALARAGKAEVVLRDRAAHPAHVADDVALDAERLDVEREVGHRVEPAGAELADRVMAHRRREGDVVIDPVLRHDGHHLVDVLARPAPALPDQERQICALALAHIAEALDRLVGQIALAHQPLACRHTLLPSQTLVPHSSAASSHQPGFLTTVAAPRPLL